MATANHLVLDLNPPLTARNAGLFISRGQGRHQDRVIDSYELIFVRQGRLGMYEEQRRFVLNAGQSLLLWPGRRHGGTENYPRDLSFYWIHWHMPLQKRSKSSHVSAFQVPQQAAVARPDRVSELYQRFLNDQESGRLTPATGALLLLLMLCEVSDTRPAESAADETTAVLAGRADRYIRTRFHEPICISGIARELQCNPDYLGRVFRKTYGRTVTEAVHERRMRKARSLLIDSALNIEQIALACGFDDTGYFRRLFKRHEGTSPFAYRRMYARAHVTTE
jgi:AraC-like DNA-binding protein